MNVKKLDNSELQVALKAKVATVREVTAEGVALLAEVAVRELFLTEGYASLFVYCVGELGFSKSMAWRWSKAARAVAADQGLLGRMRDGRVSLCVVAVLAERPEILAKADGMTLEEAQQVAARPGKAKRDIVPAPPAVKPSGAFEFRAEPTDVPAGGEVPVGAEGEAEPKREPLPTKQRVHFSASEATLKKLQRARELERGQDLDAIIEKALDAFLEKRDPLRRERRRDERREKRRVPTAKPQGDNPAATPKASGRRFPIAVKDAAHKMSGGQCSYVARNGTRCVERSRDEYDHIHPASLGGANTLENARHLCSAHHRMMTRRSFPNARRVSRGTPPHPNLKSPTDSPTPNSRSPADGSIAPHSRTTA